MNPEMATRHGRRLTHPALSLGEGSEPRGSSPAAGNKIRVKQVCHAFDANQAPVISQQITQ
jgi:hypothetical protein